MDVFPLQNKFLFFLSVVLLFSFCSMLIQFSSITVNIAKFIIYHFKLSSAIDDYTVIDQLNSVQYWFSLVQ